MSDEKDQLTAPVEIPWKLAATTRSLEAKGSFPEGSSISIFTYSPEIGDDAETRLVYLRVSVSLQSDVLVDSTAPLAARRLLDGGHPVWASIVDARISHTATATGGWNPHFLSAAPLRRSIIESGVVGDDMYEGESTGLAVGKSGSQLYESFASTTSTGSSSSGFSLLGIGLGSTSKRTSVSGTHSAVQVTDATNRDASEERQELFSHLTRVDNVLSLLSTTGVGSPHLRWKLTPRPLRMLTVDPTDPTAWYGELLRSRSSGLEGVQDLYAVAAVPVSSKQFCLDVHLRNLHVLDKPPTPPHELPKAVPLWEFSETRSFLYRRYPIGTPIDDIDVDLTRLPGLPTSWVKGFQPVIDGWWTSPIDGHLDPDNCVFLVAVRGIVLTPGPPALWTTDVTWVPYKTFREVHREWREADYLEALATSPLVRGKVVAVPLSLSLCFSVSAVGEVAPKGQTHIFKSGDAVLPPITVASPLSVGATAAMSGIAAADAMRRAVVGWNDLQRKVLDELTVKADFGTKAFNWDDPGVRDLWFRHLESLAPDDPANETLVDARGWLGLTAGDIRRLERLGVTDLQGLAASVLHAGDAEWLEREDRRLEPILATLESGDEQTPTRPILSRADATDLQRRIGERLAKSVGQPIRRSP